MRHLFKWTFGRRSIALAFMPKTLMVGVHIQDVRLFISPLPFFAIIYRWQNESKYPDCPGCKCHGHVVWCDRCGDVAEVCDDPHCDVHAELVWGKEPEEEQPGTYRRLWR